ADTAEVITTTRVRERIPDAVLHRANRVELVDATPEQLRRRMRHGDIYPPQRVDHALNGFFSTENLTALRELTHSFVADGTDRCRPTPRRYAPPVPHSTEHVLVGVTAAPGIEALLQSAGRIADRLNADLHVAHVASTWTRNGGDLPALVAVRELA